MNLKLYIAVLCSLTVLCLRGQICIFHWSFLKTGYDYAGRIKDILFFNFLSVFFSLKSIVYALHSVFLYLGSIVLARTARVFLINTFPFKQKKSNVRLSSICPLFFNLFSFRERVIFPKIILAISLFIFFSQNINAQTTTIWSENFDVYAENTGVEGPGVNSIGDYPASILKWTIVTAEVNLLEANDFLKVSDNVFQIRDVHGKGVWYSETIDISSFNNVSVSADFRRYSGTMEATDSINFYYRIDNGSWIAIVLLNDDISTSNENYSVLGLEGTSLEIKVEVILESGYLENYAFDNVLVQGIPFGISTYTFLTSGTTTFIVPEGITSIDVKAWGGGGGGSDEDGNRGGGGGGGGGFSSGTLSVFPNDIIEITVGSGGSGGSGNHDNGEDGGNTIIAHTGGSTPGTIVAYGGEGGNGNLNQNNGGDGGTAAFSGTVLNQSSFVGGDGGDGDNTEGGAGGGGAGDSENGENGDNGSDNTHNGGAGGINYGGDGGFGGAAGVGGNGSAFGGGGGAAGDNGGGGGKGGDGAVFISYCEPPTITNQPINTTVTYDDDAIFTIETGATNVSIYQWQVNSGNGWSDTGSNSPEMIILKPSVSMSGDQYRCIITNDCGSYATSNIVVLTVSPRTLLVTADDQTVVYGTNEADITESGTNSISGYTNGENSSVIAGINSISYTTNYTETTNSGSTGITITPELSGLSAANYTFSAVDGNITIIKADQNISFGVPYSTPLNEFDTIPISTYSSSGLPVSITIEPGSAATLNEDPSYNYFLTNIGTTGIVTLYGNQQGNSNYNAASQVARIFDVTKSNQFISFPSIDDITFSNGLTLELEAVASSGLTVSYSVTSGPATVLGNTLIIAGTGNISVKASQPGNASYNAASDVIQSFNVVKGTQAITINIPPGTIDETSQITAISTSGLPVTLTLGAGSTASSLNYNAGGGYYTLSGIGGSGEVYIVGNQSGNSNFLPANQIIQTIDLSKSNQTITFNTISNQTYSSSLSLPLTALASSGLTVSFSVVSGPAAIAGSTLTITGAGTVIVEASQAGDGTYNSAPTVTQQFEVYKATPVIVQSDIVKNLGDADFTISPISISSGSFSYISSDNDIFTIIGNTATIVGAGTATLDILQDPTVNYFGATATVLFTVSKASSTISMTGPMEYTYSGTQQGPETSTVTGSTGTVTYSYEGTGSTTYGPDLTKPINAGTYIATATVEEDDNYAGAASVPYPFTILKADANISVTPYSLTYNGLPHTATGVAEGISAEALSGLDLSGTTHTNAGNYINDTWIFTDITGNYYDTSGIVTNLIEPKDLIITASDGAKCFGDIFSFDGSEFNSTGLETLETIGTVTLISSGSGVGATPGDYAIIPSNATGGTFNPDNYSISYINGDLTVNSLPTLSGASQETTVCPGANAVINISGLLPDRIFSLEYSINGIPQPIKTGLSSNASGNSSFTSSALTEDNDGQTLQITGITIISETPNCSQAFTQDLVLSVKPNPILTGAFQNAVVCDGSSATINLTGLLPGTTFTLEFSINEIDQTPIENLIADSSGNSSFTTPALSTTNDGQILKILGILITGETPGCSESFEQDVVLNVEPLPEISTTGVIDELCFSDVDEVTSLEYFSTNNSPISYSIDWDTAANIAGLADQGTTAFSFTSGGGTISGIIITENTPDGNYTGIMTITNSDGCSQTQIVSIKINPIPGTGEINTN